MVTSEAAIDRRRKHQSEYYKVWRNRPENKERLIEYQRAYRDGMSEAQKEYYREYRKEWKRQRKENGLRG